MFLRVVSDWPRSPFDWDILFLLPLPWWGPVLAPVCIALVMILWGTRRDAVRRDIAREGARADAVGRMRNRRRPRAVCVHGRCASLAAAGARRDEIRAADVVQLDGLLRGACADRGAAGARRMAPDHAGYCGPITCRSGMNHGYDLWEASSCSLM